MAETVRTGGLALFPPGEELWSEKYLRIRLPAGVRTPIALLWDFALPPDVVAVLVTIEGQREDNDTVLTISSGDTPPYDLTLPIGVGPPNYSATGIVRVPSDGVIYAESPHDVNNFAIWVLGYFPRQQRTRPGPLPQAPEEPSPPEAEQWRGTPRPSLLERRL